MYITYLIIASLTGALIYEYSALQGITPIGVFVSFVLIFLLNLIIANSHKRYKRNITIFTFIIAVLAIANMLKVKFNLAEITFLDFGLIKAAGGVATLFLDKLPYLRIFYIASIFFAFFIFTIACSRFTKKKEFEQLNLQNQPNDLVQTSKTEKLSYTVGDISPDSNDIAKVVEDEEKTTDETNSGNANDEKAHPLPEKESIENKKTSENSENKETEQLQIQDEKQMHDANNAETENTTRTNATNTHSVDCNVENIVTDEPQAGVDRGFDFFSSKIRVVVSIFLIGTFLFFSSSLSSYGINSSFSNFIASSKSIGESLVFSLKNKGQIFKSIDELIDQSPASNMDYDDTLLAGYPFDKQSDMDVVFIQSETFFDITKYKNFLGQSGINIDDDIMKNFHHYQDSGISGKLFVPTVGGGTVNTEYETLTGYGVKYFARGTNVFTSVLKKKTDSFAHHYKNTFEDSTTIGIHNHTKEYWDRDRVYPLLGIDTFIDMTMFTQEQQMDLVGAWMSDKTIFDMTKDCLEKDQHKNKFILSVTVQNHGPFLESKSPIYCEGFSENESWEFCNYLGNLKISDQALKEFMDYIDSRKKPTMVVFYGDHKPDPSYDIFTTSKYYTQDERINMFSTDYFIYFNESVINPKLRRLSGSKRDISSAALNRYVQILLGDSSKRSLYIYNAMKNPDNYFDKSVINGVKNTAHRVMSLQFINKYVGEELYE